VGAGVRVLISGTAGYIRARQMTAPLATKAKVKSFGVTVPAYGQAHGHGAARTSGAFGAKGAESWYVTGGTYAHARIGGAND